MSSYLPGIVADAKPGTYKTLVDGATRAGIDYSKIWDLFAFQPETNEHLSRFSHGVLRQPATISPGLRELIAAYTSHQNACRFCTMAHAAAASELLQIAHDLRSGRRCSWLQLGSAPCTFGCRASTRAFRRSSGLRSSS